jgi:hypothetical protein
MPLAYAGVWRLFGDSRKLLSAVSILVVEWRVISIETGGRITG